MAKVTIKRRNESERADGRAALYAVLNIERIKIRLPLDIAVTSAEWDPVTERIKGRGQEVKDKNLIISNTKAKISDILVRARLTGESLTKDGFLALYRRPAETLNFVDYARRHLDELKTALQPQTLRHHKAALKKLEGYNAALQISDITPEWLQVYAAHLRKHYDNNPGTIRKNMCVIRMHYYAAMRAGKVRNNPFDVYKLPAADPSVIYLTEEELNSLAALYNSDILPENEQDVLRFFLFMTFTAMHISDAKTLQIEQIIGGEIHYRRTKTHIRVNIPLSKPAAKLVEYYQAGRVRGNLFRNLPTDQAFNRIIKRVCMRVGINKPVSAKAARHTFATLYYKKNSGDLGTLSKLLGHTSVTTTMIYAHIMKDSRVAGVSAFDDML
ncbi:site-specific integrase [uncultured Alistipes sp.]|uniref:site-specific integrase n=1 Tax=uncultured Alistipes sp. TaxID=538949 RepID=UPI0026134FB0|nr:site-specific integrase [uncultured Alistipes sp.]